MELLPNSDFLDRMLELLVTLAKAATCERSRCASIITSNFGATQKVIGFGYNSMPCNKQTTCFKDSLAPTFKSDKTCCIHAEQRAILDAVKRHPLEIIGSNLYFLRIDDLGNAKPSGAPYCSICSKLALDVGIGKFHLWHKEGWTAYDTEEYNKLTFEWK